MLCYIDKEKCVSFGFLHTLKLEHLKCLRRHIKQLGKLCKIYKVIVLIRAVLWCIVVYCELWCIVCPYLLQIHIQKSFFNFLYVFRLPRALKVNHCSIFCYLFWNIMVLSYSLHGRVNFSFVFRSIRLSVSRK